MMCADQYARQHEKEQLKKLRSQVSCRVVVTSAELTRCAD